MKNFEIILLSAAVFFSIAEKAEANIPACPAIAEVQKALSCPPGGNTCSADIDDWSGSANGVDGQPKLTGGPHPMQLKLTSRDTHGCAYDTDQDGVILYLELKK